MLEILLELFLDPFKPFRDYLGKYAGSIVGAWGATLGLIAALVLLTWLQSLKAKRDLAAAEARRKGKES